MGWASDALAYLERLFLFGLTDIRRLGQGEENNLLACDGADVVVQAQHLDASDLLDYRFQYRPRRFDQVGPHLIEQVPAPIARKRLDQMLFGGGQNAVKADHEDISEQVGVNVRGTPAHVVPLEATAPPRMMTSISPGVLMGISPCSLRSSSQPLRGVRVKGPLHSPFRALQ